MYAIKILYEDDDLIAVNKPAGLLSQGTPDPSRTHVVSALLEQAPKYKKLFLHHRLDKDTSGVLLLGKTERVNKHLTELFREHRVQKKYLALVKLSPTPLSSKNWIVKNHLAPVRGNNKKLMRMVVVKKGGWQAETHFQLLESFANALLIQAEPHTGRTHQIRIHTATLKMPILGDSLYGGKSSLVPRLMLHAEKLEFQHPLTGAEVRIEAPLPKDFETILQKLRGA